MIKHKGLLFFLFVLLTHSLSVRAAVDDYFTWSVDPDTALAGEPGSWRVIIRPKKEIKANTQFKVKFVKGIKDLQSISPALPGYVKAWMTNASGRVAINSIKTSYDEGAPYWEMNGQEDVITIVTRQADMQESDSIIIAIGEGNYDKARARVYTTANVEHIEIAMSDNGSPNNMVLSTQTPRFEIRPKRAKNIRLFVNSSAKVNEEIKLLVTNEDEHHNLDDLFTGEILLHVNDNAQVIMPQKVILTPEDSGKKEIVVKFLKEGSYFITGELLSGKIPVSPANPIRVDKHLPHIYWGDLHSHGATSRDGLGRGRYHYARYTRGLDFICATDHADHGKTIYGISDREWALQKSEIVASHEPGKFIPFVGYENSFLYPIGHYNIIFNVKDEDINSVPMYAMRVVKDIQTIWRLAHDSGIQDMLTIPHHSGKVFNINTEGNSCKNCNTFGGTYANEQYKRLIEIFSFHGLSEDYDPVSPLAYSKRSKTARSFDGPNYAQDAWAMGERLGVIASSDDHFGQPGRTVNGIVAVLADSLERTPIFNALRNKHTYGTTGERIWVDFRVNDTLMGSEIKVNPYLPAKIDVDIMGTDSLDYVEVLKWDFKRGQWVNGHPKFEVIARFQTEPEHPNMLKKTFLDEGPTDSCMYYLRVKQTNVILDFLDYKEVWAWSSPIWVSRDWTAVEPNDSLKFYTPQIRGKKVIHSWSMYYNKHVTQYQVERQTGGNSWETIYTYVPNADHQKDFEYIEEKPLNGISYYRLKICTDKKDTILSDIHLLSLVLDSAKSFQARLVQGEIILGWKVQNELYSDRYTIDLDSNHSLKRIGDIPADFGWDDTLTHYTWNTHLSSPGVYHFILSQWVAENLKDSLSTVIEIIPTGIEEKALSKTLILKRNLLSAGDRLEYKLAGKRKVKAVFVVGVDGKIIYQEKSTFYGGSWQALSTNSWPASMYRLVILTEDNLLISSPFIMTR